MTLIWFCAVLLLLAVLVFIWAALNVSKAADEAMEAQWEKVSETPEPVRRIIYPGIPLTDEFIGYMTGICDSYGVPVPLVLAVIAKESNFDAKLVDDYGQSYGLMQIQPQWHRERMARLGVIDLLDPSQNVKVGIDYLSELLDLGRGEEYAVMFYNGGEIHANAYNKRGEMSHYCSDVMKMRDCIADAALVEVVNE